MRRRFALVLVGLLCAALPLFATTWNVDVHNFAFVPANLTIAHGDTVHWHNSSGFHSVHHNRTPALFGIAAGSAPWDYTFVFNSIGDSTFHYICEVHPSTMQGTVTVQPAASIHLTAPNGGEIWAAGGMQMITWTSQNVSADVMIDLNRHYPLDTWETIFADVPNSGMQMWTVTGPASDSCRIRVMSLAPISVEDVSDANFSIHELAAPQSVVVYSNGADAQLEWPAVPNADGYNVYRSTDASMPMFPTLVGHTTTPSLTDTNAVTNNARLFYMVHATQN
jgi:plastocyanin